MATTVTQSTGSGSQPVIGIIGMGDVSKLVMQVCVKEEGSAVTITSEETSVTRLTC